MSQSIQQSYDEELYAIAKICHEANKAICESLGDFSQQSFENAPHWQKESAITGIKFVLNNPLSQPKDQHGAWCADKRADGWVYGEEKDSLKKTHPCLVDYDELSSEQRIKDAVFQAIVRAAYQA